MAERAFYILVVDAVLPPLLQLAAPVRHARALFQPFVRTQVCCFQQLECRDFNAVAVLRDVFAKCTTCLDEHGTFPGFHGS